MADALVGGPAGLTLVEPVCTGLDISELVIRQLLIVSSENGDAMWGSDGHQEPAVFACGEGHHLRGCLGPWYSQPSQVLTISSNLALNQMIWGDWPVIGKLIATGSVGRHAPRSVLCLRHFIGAPRSRSVGSKSIGRSIVRSSMKPRFAQYYMPSLAAWAGITPRKVWPVALPFFVRSTVEYTVVLSGHGRSGRALGITVVDLCRGTTRYCETPWS